MMVDVRRGWAPRSGSVRKWAIRAGIVLLVFEVCYVLAANILIRNGLLAEIINKKPEKTHISWDSAVSYLPGFFTVSGFTLRSQTERNQVYLRVADADGRISLIKLLTRTIHIRGVDASDVDFRYRERLDRPPNADRDDDTSEPPRGAEFYPEIPGLSNPPDPKPEDLYPPKRKKRPWTIKITGADVAGPVRVALNQVRIEGDGSVGGGVTVRPKKTITIHRGKLGLDRTTIALGEALVTEDLAIHSDLEFAPFPAKGAKLADVVGGISGTFVVAGQLSEKAAVSHEITPGVSTFGAGTITADLRFKKGALREGSEYSLRSERFKVRIMGLDAIGSATVSGGTEKSRGRHVTTSRVVLDSFELEDPDDESADITGSGLEVNATWDGFSLAERVPASRVEIVAPTIRIHDVSAFNDLFPDGGAFALQSGTGNVEARFEVVDRVAVGTLDLVADDIALKTQGVPLQGDLDVHANLTEGDLPNRSFDFSGTTIRLDDIVGDELSEKDQQKLETWYCDVDIQQGHIIFGKPLEADGQIRLTMFDTRPLVAVLRNFGTGPKWLSMMPNVKDVDGTMNVGIGEGRTVVDDLVLTAQKLEVLGWLHILDHKADGRLFIKYGGFAAGVGIDRGKAKVHITKPRQWFDEQQAAAEGVIQPETPAPD